MALPRWIAAHPAAATAAFLATAAAAVAGYALFLRPDPGDPRLNAFVRHHPPVSVVFTSRTEPASLDAAAPEGEGFHHPGQRLWAAREGRLRVLTPRGTVHELTWGKPLPDGGTLVDVMSPSVTLDGERVLFAGRKGGDDPGRWRIYEVGLDGSGLRQLTGGPDDPGCTAAPPLRYAADGSRLADDDRRRTDYDDVDPVEASADPRLIIFASSRTPDLGRDHARRSTTLWALHGDGRRVPITANRNNDRWPFATTSGHVAFSLWSRNREVVTADEQDVRPAEPGVPSATQPTDAWLGAFFRPGGGHFGMLVKPDVPVWRPRPLFNGRIAFMTTLDGSARTAVVQAEAGLIRAAPSSAAGPLPRSPGGELARGPDRDSDGRPLWVGTPSPCPPDGVLLTAAPAAPGRPAPDPGGYGLYLTADRWGDPAGPDLRPLFDDPELVDAEPVAAYRRSVALPDEATGPARPPLPPEDLELVGGRRYRGPVGRLFATALDADMMAGLPGQQTDAGEGPVFAAPPEGAITRVKIWAANRDRFDDPDRPRIPGAWELLADRPVKGTTGGPVPADIPTVLAGFGADGRVVKWTTEAKDAAGRRGTFYAYAGDHYSAARVGGQHFCVGCHPGHSGMTRADHRHAERVE